MICDGDRHPRTQKTQKYNTFTHTHTHTHTHDTLFTDSLAHLQLGLVLRPRHPALQLENHTRVVLHRDHPLAGIQQLGRQVAGSRPDLQHDVRRLDLRLGNHGLDHQRVFQNVLSFTLVEFQPSRSLAGRGRRRFLQHDQETQ